MGALVVPKSDRELGFPEQSNRPANFRDAFDRLAALRCFGGDDFLFQLLLGRDPISAGTNRGRFEEVRWLHSRSAPGKTNSGVP